MPFFKPVIDFATGGSPRPIFRLTAYYVVLGVSVFLISYVTYHTLRHGVVTRFPATGFMRSLYFFILTTHTIQQHGTQAPQHQPKTQFVIK